MTYTYPTYTHQITRITALRQAVHERGAAIEARRRDVEELEERHRRDATYIDMLRGWYNLQGAYFRNLNQPSTGTHDIWFCTYGLFVIHVYCLSTPRGSGFRLDTVSSSPVLIHIHAYHILQRTVSPSTLKRWTRLRASRWS